MAKPTNPKCFVMRSKRTQALFGATASDNSRDCFKRFLFMEGNGALVEQCFDLVVRPGYEIAEVDLVPPLNL